MIGYSEKKSNGQDNHTYWPILESVGILVTFFVESYRIETTAGIQGFGIKIRFRNRYPVFQISEFRKDPEENF